MRRAPRRCRSETSPPAHAIEAREHFERLRDADFRVANGGCALRPTAVARTRLAEICCALGDQAAAQDLYASLAHASDFCAAEGVLLNRGSIARVLGELAHVLGRTGAARDHLWQALHDNQRLGHRPETIKTRLALHLVLSESESRQAAGEQLTLARAEAARIGMALPRHPR